MNQQIIAVGVFLGIILGLSIDLAERTIGQPIVYVAEAKEVEPKEVLIEARINWTEERIKEEIRETFPEAPETFIRIAKCESNFLPHAYNPTNNSHDGGILQISQKYHGEEMEKMKLDPYNVQDNLKFGRILYEESGLSPWSASKHCWNK